MKKILFISNISKKITNFSIPSIIAAQSLGYEFHLAANYSAFDDDASKYNVKIHHLDLARNPFSVKNIRAYKQLVNLIQEEEFDVIHCNTPTGGFLGRLCGKKAKVKKIIYTAHGFHFYNGAPLINNTLFKWVERWLAHYTDAIITINKEDFEAAQKFRLRNGGKVYYVPGVGIETSQIASVVSRRDELLKELGLNDPVLLLISIGELNRNKNHKIILEALRMIKNQKIHYLVCGTGSEKERLIEIAEKYGIKNNIHFLGYRSDVHQLLKSCDVFIQSSYREGLSRSIMEAMSAGLPCVVSKIRGNVDLIKEGEGGFFCKPDDSDCFAHSINKLANDTELRKTMGTSNLKAIQKFDVENVKEEIRKVYKEVLP